MECIVHFDVVYEDQTKELRGLIFTEEGKKPSSEDIQKMLEEMGYQLRVKDLDHLSFEPAVAGAEYQEVRIRRLETGDKKVMEDQELKSIVANLLPSKSRPI